MGLTRILAILIATALAGILIAGCNGDDHAESEATVEGITLDLSTLQADTPQGKVDAIEIPDAFVGDVTDELFIAVVLPEAGTAYYEAGEAIVYLCDSDEVATWLLGNRSAETTVLESDGVRVEFQVVDDAVTGIVVFDGEEQEPFVAEPVEDDAGFFMASETDDEVSYIGGWIVLSATLQRGWWGAAEEEEEEELQMLRRLN